MQYMYNIYKILLDKAFQSKLCPAVDMTKGQRFYLAQHFQQV